MTFDLTIDNNGCFIGIGEVSTVMSSAGMTFQTEGFAFKDRKDDTVIENDRGALDIAACGCTITASI